MRSRLKGVAEKLLGARIIRDSHHGHIDWHDIRRTGLPVRTIVDVGAHVGESAQKFAKAFPDARIHSLEPVSASFEQLQKNVADLPAITCHQIALGSEDGTATIHLADQSTMHSLVRASWSVGEEEVQVRRLDSFTDETAVEHIDILKIDAEGMDLEVLRGADRLLAEKRIGFLLVEVGFHVDGGSPHVYFVEAIEFLASYGVQLFGFYDQHLEYTDSNRLRSANACFIDEQHGAWVGQSS